MIGSFVSYLRSSRRLSRGGILRYYLFAAFHGDLVVMDECIYISQSNHHLRVVLSTADTVRLAGTCGGYRSCLYILISLGKMMQKINIPFRLFAMALHSLPIYGSEALQHAKNILHFRSSGDLRHQALRSHSVGTSFEPSVRNMAPYLPSIKRGQ